MAKITKVPNGPLIKKKGPFKGSTLKVGGVIKKAQDGFNKVKPGTKQTTPKFRVPESRFVITNDTAKVKPTRWVNNPMPPSKDKEKFPMPSEAVMDSVSKASIPNFDTSKLMKKKAQSGVKLTPQQKRAQIDSIASIKRADIVRKKDSILNRNATARGMTRAEVQAQQQKDKNKPDAVNKDLTDCTKRTDKKGSCTTGQTGGGQSTKDNKRNGGIMKKAQTGGTYYATSKGRVGRLSGSTIGNTIVDVRNESIDTTGYSKGKKEFKKIESSSFDGNTIKKVKRQDVPKVISELKKGATRKEDYRTPNQKKKSKMKAGGMIKRADGSMSKRGLYDNIRANKGSGKKPTKQMLVQEKKIKAKSKK
jgi:hypothetical protein